MKWASLNVKHESTVEWLSIPAELRGHHRALLIFCSRLENGGELAGCRDWNDFVWWANCGFRRSALTRMAAAGLVEWVDGGTGLRVRGYDLQAEHNARTSRETIRKMLESRWSAYRAARRGATRTTGSPPTGAPSGAATSHPVSPLALSPSGSGSLPPAALEESALPSPKGGAGGGEGQGSGGQRAPHGAGDPGTGPEGFETWWAEYCSYRPCERWWKPLVMEQWVLADLEGQADEIREFCRWKSKHAWKRDPGPDGRSMIPTPRALLTKEGWRKRGPWNAPPAPPRPRSRETQPEVVDLQVGHPATLMHRHLMDYLADVDVSEEDKNREKRRWIDAHPGELPPWTRQQEAQQPNGRTS